MTKQKQSTGSKIYSGVSTFGMIMADFKAIIGTVIGIIMIIAGIVFIRRQGVYTQQGTGIVNQNTCLTDGSQPVPSVAKDSNGNYTSQIQYTWNCTVSVKNTEDNSDNPSVKTKNITEITNTIPQSYNPLTKNRPGMPYDINTTVPIWVNPKNPKDFDLQSDDTHVIGWFLVIIGPILIIGSIAWAYFATKYKIIGAYEGVRTGVDMIRGN